MLRALLALSTFSITAAAQWLSLGVTGAVPISPHSLTDPPGDVLYNDSGSSSPPFHYLTLHPPNDFYQKPYGVGPHVEVFLPWHVSLEAGMLYERFHQDIGVGLVVFKGGGASFGQIAGLAADAYAFPLLARYNFGHRRFTPFIDAGATLRHLGVFQGQGFQLDAYQLPHQQTFRVDPGKAIDIAETAGGGVRFHLARLDVSPEIRFLHWTSPYEQPKQGQAMLLVNIAWPARK